MRQNANTRRRVMNELPRQLDALRKEHETLKGLFLDYLSMPSCDGQRGRQVLRAELSSRIGGTYDEKEHIFMDKEST